jgi:hypothetical protein
MSDIKMKHDKELDDVLVSLEKQQFHEVLLLQYFFKFCIINLKINNFSFVYIFPLTIFVLIFIDNYLKLSLFPLTIFVLIYIDNYLKLILILLYDIIYLSIFKYIYILYIIK